MQLGVVQYIDVNSPFSILKGVRAKPFPFCFHFVTVCGVVSTVVVLGLETLVEVMLALFFKKLCSLLPFFLFLPFFLLIGLV